MDQPTEEQQIQRALLRGDWEDDEDERKHLLKTVSQMTNGGSAADQLKPYKDDLVRVDRLISQTQNSNALVEMAETVQALKKARQRLEEKLEQRRAEVNEAIERQKEMHQTLDERVRELSRRRETLAGLKETTDDQTLVERLEQLRGRLAEHESRYNEANETLYREGLV
jgi:chromosome segregation ATPase